MIFKNYHQKIFHKLIKVRILMKIVIRIVQQILKFQKNINKKFEIRFAFEIINLKIKYNDNIFNYI